MDRRSFLSRLIVGAAAAPAVVSALAKAPPPAPVFIMQPIWLDGYHGSARDAAFYRKIAQQLGRSCPFQPLLATQTFPHQLGETVSTQA